MKLYGSRHIPAGLASAPPLSPLPWPWPGAAAAVVLKSLPSAAAAPPLAGLPPALAPALALALVAGCWPATWRSTHCMKAWCGSGVPAPTPGTAVVTLPLGPKPVALRPMTLPVALVVLPGSRFCSPPPSPPPGPGVLPAFFPALPFCCFLPFLPSLPSLPFEPFPFPAGASRFCASGPADFFAFLAFLGSLWTLPLRDALVAPRRFSARGAAVRPAHEFELFFKEW